MYTDQHGWKMMERLEQELSEKAIGASREVSNFLGGGFLESVHHQALNHELASRDIPARSQCPVSMRNKGFAVGDFMADLIVEGRLVLEFRPMNSFLFPCSSVFIRGPILSTSLVSHG